MLRNKQSLPGPRSPTLLQLSHLILHQRVPSDSFTSRSLDPVRYSTAVHPDGVSVFTEEFSLLHFSVSNPSIFRVLVVRYYCCGKLKNYPTLWPGNKYLIMWSMCFWICVLCTVYAMCVGVLLFVYMCVFTVHESGVSENKTITVLPVCPRCTVPLTITCRRSIMLFFTC